MQIIFWMKDDRNKSLRIYHNGTSTLMVLEKKLILGSNKFFRSFYSRIRRLRCPYHINIKRHIFDSKIFTQNLHRNELVFYFYFLTWKNIKIDELYADFNAPFMTP